MPRQPFKANNPIPAAPARTFERVKVQKSDFQRLVDAAAFVFLMGALVAGAGLVLYFGFQNRFSIYLLDVGLLICLYAAFIRILDVGLKIIGVRD